MDSTLDKLAHDSLKDRIKREKHNAHKYRRLYTELLTKHTGILQESWSLRKDFEAETDLIHKMWTSERNALAMGVAFGCLVLASLRWLPPVLIRHVGGPEKALALQKAEEESKKMGSYKYQRVFGWVVEGGFSLWAGNRVYQYQSKSSNGAYETLAKIPLCRQRSVISETVCNEWVDITSRKIPVEFWYNLSQGELSDERTWRSIVKFSNNCIRREAYQRKLQEGDNNPHENATSAILLPKDVPLDISLSGAEAKQLVLDGKF